MSKLVAPNWTELDDDRHAGLFAADCDEPLPVLPPAPLRLSPRPDEAPAVEKLPAKCWRCE